MEVRPDLFEAAKSDLFDTERWGPFCDVTLTLKQARQSEMGAWIKIDDYSCRQAFRRFRTFSIKRYMEPHFVAIENVSASFPYLRRVRSAAGRCVHASVAHPGVGTFTVLSNCHATWVLSLLKT
jgi:hypothetical protein